MAKALTARKQQPSRPSRADAESAVRTLIRWAGDDPDREGLAATPARVARAYAEWFAGYAEDPKAFLQRTFEEVDGYDEIVVLRDIRFESHCEHHMAPIIGRVHIGYLPRSRVVGISKLARLVEAYAKRLQIQERFTAQIANTINDVLVSAAAGALRRYLLERGEDVSDLEIRVAVPVNMRPLDEAIKLGNQFGLVFLALPLGITDAEDRLAEVKRRMDDIKASVQPAVALGVLTALGYAPGALQPLAVQFFGSKASAVLTNVPGPREQLYLAGKRLKKAMFWVPQSGRLGLGISILSYNGEVMVGVASDTGLVPDPERIVAGFKSDLDELLAQESPRRTAARSRVRR